MRSTRSVLCSNGCCYECEACSRKPGSPTLCEDCLERRAICNAKCSARSKGANSTQVGGDHYRKVEVEKGAQQHWDRAWSLYREVWFILNITKYTERYRSKGGVKDLNKAKHYLEKLIELEEADAERKILSSMTTEEASEGKDIPEEACTHSVSGEHTWLNTSRVGTIKCFYCGKVEKLPDPSVMHGMDGDRPMCGAPVGQMTHTMFRPYVNCPECKEKFK